MPKKKDDAQLNAYIGACLIADGFKAKHTSRSGLLRCGNPEALALGQIYASIAVANALVLLMRVVQQSGMRQLDNNVLDQIRLWEATVAVAPEAA